MGLGVDEGSSPRAVHIAGVVIVIVIAASQTGGAELTNNALNGFDGPWFLMWLHTAFMVLVLPLVLLLGQLGVVAVPPDWRANGRRYLRLQLLFYPVWVIANYAYVRALLLANPGVVTAIFGSCSAFVALFSRVALKEPFDAARAASVLLAVLGVALVGVDATRQHGESSGNSTDAAFGVLLALVSSVAAAVYKVGFKYCLGSPGAVELSFFLGILGVVNIVVGLLPTVLLGTSGVEDKFWDPPQNGTRTADWGAIMGGSVFTLVFNFSIAVGIAITYPLFIAVGTVITIPATLTTDYVARGETVGGLGIAGATVIVASFCVLAAFAGAKSAPAREEGRGDEKETDGAVLAFFAPIGFRDGQGSADERGV